MLSKIKFIKELCIYTRNLHSQQNKSGYNILMSRKYATVTASMFAGNVFTEIVLIFVTASNILHQVLYACLFFNKFYAYVLCKNRYGMFVDSFFINKIIRFFLFSFFIKFTIRYTRKKSKWYLKILYDTISTVILLKFYLKEIETRLLLSNCFNYSCIV